MGSVFVLNDDEVAEALYALARRIDYLRRTLVDAVRRSGVPYDGMDEDGNRRWALRNVLWLRQAEAAYRRLGGTDHGCHPAVYRTPPVHHIKEPV